MTSNGRVIVRTPGRALRAFRGDEAISTWGSTHQQPHRAIAPCSGMHRSSRCFRCFPVNYQPSTSRAPRKSWAADDLPNKRTARRPTVLSLFPRLIWVIQEAKKGALLTGKGFSASYDEIRMLRQYHNRRFLSISQCADLWKPLLLQSSIASWRGLPRRCAAMILLAPQWREGSQGSPAAHIAAEWTDRVRLRDLGPFQSRRWRRAEWR